MTLAIPTDHAGAYEGAAVCNIYAAPSLSMSVAELAAMYRRAKIIGATGWVPGAHWIIWAACAFFAAVVVNNLIVIRGQE